MSTDPQTLRSGPVAVAIRRHRLIAVLRRIKPRERLLALVDDLLVSGVRLFEVTLDAPDAAGDLAAVRARVGEAGWVGAGTVRTSEQLTAAIDAGATFAVSPILDHAVLGSALEAGLPFVPGAYTPTEADVAWRAGSTFVKLFPASSLGASHVRELRGPLPEIETVVTGGVDHTNGASFLGAGATALGVGSALQRMSGDERRGLVELCGASR